MKPALFVAALLLTGCEDLARQMVVRARAADDFGCAEYDVQVIPGSGAQYMARGCSHKALYSCVPPKGPGEVVCTPVLGPPGGAPTVAPPPPPMTPFPPTPSVAPPPSAQPTSPTPR